MEFIKTPDEYAMIIAIEKSQRIADLSDLNPLLGVVSKWRLYIGVPKEDVSEELAIVVDFIFKHYGFLTIAEVELAYNLSVVNKLEDIKFFGQFSPMYVGKVLSAYLYYRKMTLADPIRKKEKAQFEEEEKSNKPTPQQESDLTKEIIEGFYKQWQETGSINDVFNICYNFFRKVNVRWLTVTKEDIDISMQKGKLKYQQRKQKEDAGFLGEINDNAELEIKRHARNYLVEKYFETVDIIILLNNIKPELFANLEA